MHQYSLMPHTARCKARFRKPGPGVDVLLPLQMCAHVLGSHANTISSVLPGGLSEADRLLHLFCSASLCSCSSRFFFFPFLSKVNIRSGSWIRRIQLAPQKKKKCPQPYVEYKWRCTEKICSVANSILLSRHPVCTPSCSPNAKRASWIHGRKTETRTEEEAHAVIPSCLMASVGKRDPFT